MTKRIAALFLVLVMLVFPVACAADDTEKPAETTPQVADTTAAPTETDPPVTEPAYKPELPDVKFEGESLIIIHRASDAQHYKEICLQADDITGDIVNDAVYKRNLAIEENTALTL